MKDFGKALWDEFLKKFLNITLLIMTFIIALFLVIQGLLFALFPSHEKKEDVETHDINDYFNKTYLEYTGGKQAEIFFNDFVSTDGYKDIAFHYLDDRDTIHIGGRIPRKCTIFVLDVYYEEDAFWEISDKILTELTGKSAKDSLEFVFTSETTFDEYDVEKDTGIYKDNTAAILFDPTYNTIRYAFLFDYTGSSFEIVSSIERVLHLSNSNYSKENWLFDYSDIATNKDETMPE